MYSMYVQYQMHKVHVHIVYYITVYLRQAGCMYSKTVATRKSIIVLMVHAHCTKAVDMNGRFQMQGGKNWILPKQINANRFFWDSHWLEIWSNHFCPSMGLNGGSVATDTSRCPECFFNSTVSNLFIYNHICQLKVGLISWQLM